MRGPRTSIVQRKEQVDDAISGLRATLPITVVLAVLAASCGSDSNSASTTAPRPDPDDGSRAATTEAPASSARRAASRPPRHRSGADHHARPTPRAAGRRTPIKIGFIGPRPVPWPRSGRSRRHEGPFDKVNAAGGSTATRSRVVTKDDAYDPAKSKRRAEAIQGDDLRLGHPDRHAERRGPRGDSLLACPRRGSGRLLRGGSRQPPLTVGGIMAYPTEAIAWTEFLKDKYERGQGRPARLQQRLREVLARTVREDGGRQRFDVVSTVTHERRRICPTRSPRSWPRTPTSSSPRRRPRSAPT